nr:reverse transcriptase domain-containing protein [Tanacetum cinerariifolium]
MPEHQSDIFDIHNDDGNPSRANIKQALAKDHDIKFYCSNDIKSKIKILDHKHAEGTVKNSQDNKVLRREEALDDEVCLKEQILSLMHRFADRFTNQRPKINWLNSLPDDPLIEYSRRNGDPPVPDLRTMEEFCQPSLNGRGGPIAPIAIQAMNFGLKNDMIQQVQNSCQIQGLPGDDANKHLDRFLDVTQSIKVNGVTDDALHLYLFPHSLTHHA